MNPHHSSQQYWHWTPMHAREKENLEITDGERSNRPDAEVDLALQQGRKWWNLVMCDESLYQKLYQNQMELKIRNNICKVADNELSF